MVLSTLFDIQKQHFLLSPQVLSLYEDKCTSEHLFLFSLQGDPGDVISANRFGEKGAVGLPGLPGGPVSEIFSF